jgi:hypothetical protein
MLTIISSTEVRDLEAEVAARIDLLRRIIHFAEWMMHERGRMLRSSIRFKIFELRDFFGFTFNVRDNLDGDRGSTLWIYHHPNSRYKNGLAPVLQVYWEDHSVVECLPMKFFPGLTWQKALLELIKRGDILLIETSPTLTPSQKGLAIRREERLRQQRIEAAAKRLFLL